MAGSDILLLRVETNLKDRFMQGRRVGAQVDFDLCNAWLNIYTKAHGESCTQMLQHKIF
jgi:hypothetical protein